MADSEIQAANQGIAVIGMTGRFPSARNLDEFWENLKNGIESVSFFSDEELDESGIDPEIYKQPNYVRAKAILEDSDLFDAYFFDYSPKEAALMDPQQRLFLECAHEALENAGYDPERFPGWIGVYGGCGRSSYWLQNLHNNPNIAEEDSDSIFIGNEKDFLTTRVSFKLNLTGPSFNIQTACSTSLVAINVACQSLLTYQCDIALAGGVTISLPQKEGYLYQEDSVVSPDGHCRAFDAQANGIVPGNGVGIVVLKRLEEALADGDTIHAVIKGTALNNDGFLKMSYSAPSVEGQAQAILIAQQMAEISADEIGYVETHGTATHLGDPIEIAALTKAFRETTNRKGFCGIGSLKTNVGHLDAAAGVGAFIKTVLALKNKQIPPSLHFESPNPEIDFANSPFFVNTKLTDWQTSGQPRRAGVSAFGIGGTNAHLVVEEAPVSESSPSRRKYQILPLSAKTDTALETSATNLAAYLKSNSDTNIADVAYTLQVGRRRLSNRQVLVCQDHNDAIASLESKDPTRVFTNVRHSNNRPVVFMFPGGGTQYANMGLEIYQQEIVFRQQVDRCAEILQSLLGYDIRQLLFPPKDQTETASQKLEQVSVALSALFTIEYSLAQLWMSWGIQPLAVIGHSLGEYVAATLAGVFSVEDALAIVVERGRLMEQAKTGKMLIVPMSAKELEPLLENGVEIAAINSPSLCVVSGSSPAIESFSSKLEAQQVNIRPLHIEVASHSACVVPILEAFEEFLAKIPMHEPKLPLISNVTGTYIQPSQATDPKYWSEHLRKTVRFAEGLEELLKVPDILLLEVGPGNTLSAFAMQHPQTTTSYDVFSSIRHPKTIVSDMEFLLTTVGKLWLSGVDIDWTGFHAGETRKRIPLPTYPFERESYKIEPNKNFAGSFNYQQPKQRKSNIAEWFYIPSWRRTLPEAPLGSGSLIGESLCWLVFADEHSFGVEMVNRLKREKQDVITVFKGDRFAPADDGGYYINPELPSDYTSLIREIKATEKSPTRIVHFWNLTPDISTSGKDKFAKWQAYGYYSLIYLAKALTQEQTTGSTKILVISSQVQNVIGTEALCPEKATMLGACQVIPQEENNIACISIDLSLPEAEAEPERVVGQLLAEIIKESPEKIIAYRNRQRFVRKFENVLLEKDAQIVRPLREEGVYLIFGGLGRVGLLLALDLAQRVKAKLVLVSRSELPPRSEWESWFKSHDESDKTAYKIRNLIDIEKAGGEVMTIAADVTDLDQMRSLRERIQEKFGQIHGVFHAAAITSNRFLLCPVKEVGIEESTVQFAPKVFGLYLLEEVFGQDKPDFFVLLSSNASILGGLGFCAYSAANHFLDYFAADRNHQSAVPWISTNWDRWLLDEHEQEEAYTTSMDAFAMTPQQSLEAMRRIITQALAEQVVVTPGNLQDRLKIWIQQESKQNNTKQTRPSLSLARRNVRNSYVAPSNDIEQTIADIWQELLGVEKIGIYDNFFELGGHSLIAIQLLSRLLEAFEIKLNLRTLFETPTVASLADIISKTLTENVPAQELIDLLEGLENLTEQEVQVQLEKSTTIHD
nr:AesB [Aetokthonos hydrillicola Thurmond2011]